jgi:hypothetical protein
MARPSLLAILLSIAAAPALAGDCVPAPNHHCIGIKGFGYVPNQLTVDEGDTVEFAASSFHPLRQVIRTFPSTTALPGGLLCDAEPCIKVMDASVVNVDGLPIFHYICVNHIPDVMRGDIFIRPRTIFKAGFED